MIRLRGNNPHKGVVMKYRNYFLVALCGIAFSIPSMSVALAKIRKAKVHVSENSDYDGTYFDKRILEKRDVCIPLVHANALKQVEAFLKQQGFKIHYDKKDNKDSLGKTSFVEKYGVINKGYGVEVFVFETSVEVTKDLLVKDTFKVRVPIITSVDRSAVDKNNVGVRYDHGEIYAASDPSHVISNPIIFDVKRLKVSTEDWRAYHAGVELKNSRGDKINLLLSGQLDGETDEQFRERMKSFDRLECGYESKTIEGFVKDATTDDGAGKKAMGVVPGEVSVHDKTATPTTGAALQ